ncbi:hypothetical protein H2248_004461 [Termitomyces sp. 'cryptogamus']|nr:hypothetical protein H2248_004461 [Termitomyces sp. 'cryptogamus']
MPALNSRIHHGLTPSASAELQAARQKADIAIQKLRESGDRDVIDVLVTRYEELKERHDRLLRLQETVSTEEFSTTSTDQEKVTTTRQINMNQLEDGTFELTFPSDEAHDQPRVFILSSPAFEKDKPTQNIMVMAEELIRTAMVTIGSNEENFHESQIMYLMNIYDSLTSQEEKIDVLEKIKASPVALEIAAELYLSDAFRYLQSTQRILVRHFYNGGHQ